MVTSDHTSSGARRIGPLPVAQRHQAGHGVRRIVEQRGAHRRYVGALADEATERARGHRVAHDHGADGTALAHEDADPATRAALVEGTCADGAAPALAVAPRHRNQVLVDPLERVDVAYRADDGDGQSAQTRDVEARGT